MRHVGRPADARLEHAADPDGDAALARDVVHPPRLEQPPTRPGLMLMIAARPQLDGGRGVVRVNGSTRPGRSASAAAPAAPRGRPGPRGPSGCSIITRPNSSNASNTAASASLYAAFASTESGTSGQRFANGADHLHVAARLDLQLDPLVPLVQVAADLLEHRLGRAAMPTLTPQGTRSRTAPRYAARRRAPGPQPRVQDRRLEGGLRHPVPAHPGRAAGRPARARTRTAAPARGTRNVAITAHAPSFHSAE